MKADGQSHSRLDDPRQCQALSATCIISVRFAVSCIQVNSTGTVVIVAHEDATAMARLGRVWSIVEPDELGAVNVYHRVITETTDDSEESKRESSEKWKCIMRETFPMKIRAVSIIEPSRQFVIGTETGAIIGYSLPTKQQPQPKLLWKLDAHGPHPVTGLAALGDGNRLVTIGLDNAVRIIDVVMKPIPTGELYSGGRLTKRLKGSSYLTSVALDTYGRAYIGSSGGDVFIFDTTTAPRPAFLHQFASHDGAEITALATWSRATDLARSQKLLNGPLTTVDCFRRIIQPVIPLLTNHLLLLNIPRSSSSSPSALIFIAHGSTVSLYDIQNQGYEKRMTRLKKFVPLTDYIKASSMGKVTCLSFNSERRMLLAGYASGVVAMWSLNVGPEDSPKMSTATLVSHPDVASVTSLFWTEADKIFTGTDEGRVKIWTLTGCTEDYEHVPDIDDDHNGRNTASVEAIQHNMTDSTIYSGLLDAAPTETVKARSDTDEDEW
ncbi:hypothetical protein FOL47_001524 [Perkinsus chesapeaki]|uniref:Uncharacterized protein n=1 Tax=Perkinsus chesapeaki TaxID=330153 RepID=A0A7J6MIL3_PERCH|nr:hypothetical protein FOL47_001524 [Perkinsus chesapeaki]